LRFQGGVEHLVPEEDIRVGASASVTMFDEAGSFECPYVAPDLALAFAKIRG
jgi:hypothetical protein